MYNMPVRRKLMKEAIDIENIRVRLESFALMHPKISLSLRNDSGQSKVIQTKKSNSTMSTFMQLFGLEKSQGLVEVDHTVDQFTVTGYISVQPHLTKALQFIYVNKRVVLKTKIHKMMNYLLARTSIISNRLHPATPQPGKSSSPPKGLKLHGIYVINIECPAKEYDICMDPTKTLVEFGDWDKLLLCIEEMVIKFAEEEKLAISLDERFKRSGRDQVTEEESQEEPHSSQALLQIFSLKRSAENSNSKGEPQEKYGRTLCTYDNLSAVHSIPVRRKKNGDKDAQRYDEINSDEDEVILRADEGRQIKDMSSDPSQIGANKETGSLDSVKVDERCNDNSVLRSTPEQSLSPRVQSMRSPEKIQEARNKVRSSLDMFRRMVSQNDDDTTNSHPSPEDQSLIKATVSTETEKPDSETHDEANSKDSNKKRSSLEEFINFYNEDKKKCKQEPFETPKELVRSTPKEPPPLRVASSSRTFEDDASQKASVFSTIKNTGGDGEQNNKKSLSKTLSEGWKKHQAKAKSLKSLQKFEFQRNSSNQSKCINKNTGYQVSQRDKSNSKSDIKSAERKTRYQIRRSLRHKIDDQGTVQASGSDSDSDFSGKALRMGSSKSVDLDCSFKFQPILESEIKEFESLEKEEIVDDEIISHTSTDRLERRSLGSEIVLSSREPSERFTEESVANNCDKSSELNYYREDIQRFISDKNNVESSNSDLVHEPLRSQVKNANFFTTVKESDFVHQTVNPPEDINQQLFQTSGNCGHEELYAKTHQATKENLDLYTHKEISPTQPFVIDSILSEKNDEAHTTQQIVTEQCSDQTHGDTQEGSGLLGACMNESSMDSLVKCTSRVHDLDLPDNPENIKYVKVCDSENHDDINIKYMKENQNTFKTVNAYSIQEQYEAFPLSKNNFPNTEVNFRLTKSSSEISTEESQTCSGSIQAVASPIRNSEEIIHKEKESHNSDIQSTPINTAINSDLQNPLSASLHFSELTIPSTRDSQLISQCTASLTDTYNARTFFGSSVPSLSSASSCVTEEHQSARNKIPSYDIVFHGKMIHIDGKNPSLAPSDHSQEALPKLVEQSEESAILHKKTYDREVDDLAESDIPIGSTELSNDSHQNSEDQISNNEIASKEAPSESNRAHLLGSNNDNLTHRSKVDCLTGQATKQSTNENLKNLWKEVTTESGRKVYVNLQTGNTSYEAPVVKEMPEWTSSQPQGAPVLKIPSSGEPEADGGHQKQDFVLTHGYSAFMSWKKRREMEKKKVSENSEVRMSGSTAVNSVDTQQGALNNEEEGESLLSPGMKDAIQSILQDSEMDDDSIKWSEKPSNLGTTEEKSSEVAQICQEWEPPTFAMDADVLSSKVQMTGIERGMNKESSIRIYNIVHPYKFSQEMLQTCRVLGQLDKKFIACEITYTSCDPTLHKVSEIIVLFDQHAVDERVRLETLTEENYETLDNGERVIRTCMITPPLEMTLPESEVRLMMAYTRIFIQWGLHFTQVSASQVNFHSIPSILVARERHELRQRRCQSATAIIESIVRDVCYTLHQTGGIVSTMPKPLMNVLCSQACRGAIKFGDELTYDECENLVKSLSTCALPFQCAHGRPSIVPVVNLTHLAKGNKEERKPKLHKLREAIDEEKLGEEIME
ncbi:DNA mismatch repair protein Mlh3-like isoform X2 [Penaeus japonicus]|nr:DNA mismatch repair protein Mlh3-like isoform X2 [Penaeus japonicus]